MALSHYKISAFSADSIQHRDEKAI